MKKLKQFILKKLGIVSLKKRVKDLEKENAKLKKSVQEEKNKLAALDREYRAHVRECDRRYNEMKRHRERFDRYILALQKDMAAVKRNITGLEKYNLAYGKELNQDTRTPRIIVSITSFPARIHAVPSVLEHLLVQSVRPDKVVLWLSLEQFPNREEDLPQELLDMQKYGIDIRWCEGDIRAYKKTLPALKAFPDDLIIIVDDDLVYRSDFIETLYKAHLQHPDAIIASRVHEIALDEDGKIASYADWPRERELEQGITREDYFFTGGAGTLFPPHIFPEEVYNLDVIRELCPHADDIWLNIMAAMEHVPIVNTANNHKLTYVEGTQDNRLWDINKDQNDVQLRKLVDYYKEKLVGTYYEKM